MIAPEKKQELIGELAEKNAGRLKTALLGALDDGWLLWSKGSPRERLRAYLANTLASDVPLVTDPELLKKQSRGEAPSLLAVEMLASGAVQEGRLPAPPTFWPQILSTLPPYVFEKLSRDFRDLLKAEEGRDGSN